MIKVLCLEDSKPEDKNILSVKKGGIYHVFEVIEDSSRYYKGSNIYYGLVEDLKSMHHHSLFTIAPFTDERKLFKRKLKIKI